MTTDHRTDDTGRRHPAQASLYQQLRGHLAALKLHTAAEAPARRARPRRRRASCR